MGAADRCAHATPEALPDRSDGGSPVRAEGTPPARVLLVRHGLVENPRRLLYGRLPGFSLSASGREQAEATARRLATEQLAAIRSSPLERARETAAIIAAHHPGIEIGIDERLNEVRWVREGIDQMQWRALRQRAYDPDVMLPGDESLDEIAGRIGSFLTEQARRFPGATVVAVTHGDVVAVARAIAAKRPLVVADFERDYPAPASVTPILVWADGSTTLTPG